MHDVLPSSLKFGVRKVVTRQNQKRKAAFRGHVDQNISNGMAGSGPGFICFDLISMLILEVVFQIPPRNSVPMPNKYNRPVFSGFRLDNFCFLRIPFEDVKYSFN